MKVRITARRFDLTEDLKQAAETRLQALSKYNDNIIDLHLKLDKEKYRHTADLNATVYGAVLSCRADSNDMYASVDEVANKMEKQVKKHKARLQDKGQRKVAEAKEAMGMTSKSSDEDEVELD